MLTSPDAYAIAWAVYAACFVIAYFSFSRLTRNLRPQGLRQVFKALLIVLFLTPVEVDPERNWYAPAWLEGGYESILGEVSAAAGAFFNLAVAAAVMLLVLIVDAWWRRRRSAAD